MPYGQRKKKNQNHPADPALPCAAGGDRVCGRDLVHGAEADASRRHPAPDGRGRRPGKDGREDCRDREAHHVRREEYCFTEVVSFSSIKKLLGIEWKFTESSFLASYDGVVEAGIDCSKIKVEKDDESKEIVVTLPPAEARPANIDPNSLIVYSEKEGTGNHISIEDYNNSLIELENAAEQKAIARGVLDRANENAQHIIRGVVGSLVDLSEYRLSFRTLPEKEES